MASYDKVNYSLRPNKAIERALAFESIRILAENLGYKDSVFVGLGSVWFTDFHIAHRYLGVDDMVSFELESIGYSRAMYNAPFKTVSVINKLSTEGIQLISADPHYNDRPWIVWLDYDFELNEIITEDIRLLAEHAPANSTVIVTFDCKESLYGPADGRLKYLQKILGDVAPDEITEEEVIERLPETLVQLTNEYFVSAAAQAGRPGGFTPAFRMIYTDSTTMATAGGVLNTPGAIPIVKAITMKKSWTGVVSARIETPHLTIKEMLALQGKLPTTRKLTRKSVQKIGFDLMDAQVESFWRFYKHYPAFAQIVV